MARAVVLRGEPVGRAERGGGCQLGVGQLPGAVRERLGEELIDELLAGARSEEEIVGPGGLLAQLSGRLVERAIDAGLSEQLGSERGQAPPGGSGGQPERTTAEDAAQRSRGADRDA